MTLILSFYLPIAAGDKLYANAAARKMVLCVAMLIVLTGLAIEGSGAIINHGAKVAFMHARGERTMNADNEMLGAPAPGSRWPARSPSLSARRWRGRDASISR